MLTLELSLSSSLTASDSDTQPTLGELFNISTLDPLLPTLLITTLCLCILLVITYHSFVLVREVFWASQQSPSPLDPSAEVVLTEMAVGGEELKRNMQTCEQEDAYAHSNGTTVILSQDHM